MKAIELIKEEQDHQRDIGYTPETDAQMDTGEIGRAGLCIGELAISEIEGVDIDWPHAFWPEGWPSDYNDKSQLELLVIAAALLASEIDRLIAKGGM